MLASLIVEAVFTVMGYVVLFSIVFVLLSMLGRFLEMILRIFWF
ncbi:MAG: hypothetical protein ACRC5T_02480 [Cetobacterium sp.]